MSMSTVQQPMPDNKGQQPSSLENAAKILGIGLSIANTGTGIYNAATNTDKAANVANAVKINALPTESPAMQMPAQVQTSSPLMNSGSPLDKSRLGGFR